MSLKRIVQILRSAPDGDLCGAVIPDGGKSLYDALSRDPTGKPPERAPYSLFLWILPLMVLGSSSRKTTMRGYLYGAVRFLT